MVSNKWLGVQIVRALTASDTDGLGDSRVLAGCTESFGTLVRY